MYSEDGLWYAASVKEIDVARGKESILVCFDDYGNEEYVRVIGSEFANDKAFAQDASDYHADLITTSDFGCVQFEHKDS